MTVRKKATNIPFLWKGIFVLSCLTVFLCSANSQQLISADGGITYNTIACRTLKGYGVKYAGRNGLQAGIRIMPALGRHLFLFYGVGVIQKNYSIEPTDSLNGFSEQVSNTYIQVPLGLRVQRNTRHWFYCMEVGFFAGYWAKGFVEGYFPDVYNGTVSAANPEIISIPLRHFKERYHFDTNRDARASYGYMAATGILYEIKRAQMIGINICCYRSFSDQQKSFASSLWRRYDRTAGFGLSYVTNLKELFHSKRN